MTNNQPAFTLGGRAVLQRANQLAQERNQVLITPEHILLGLLQTPRNAALAVLSALGVDLERLARQLEAGLGPAQPIPGPAQIVVDRGGALSPQARELITDAIAEAREKNIPAIDERLLLLGILRRPATNACQALMEQGVTLLRARAALDQSPLAAYIAPEGPAPSLREIPVRPSPVFLGLLALAAGGAFVAYQGGAPARYGLFVFVAAGWLISLSLHEFGHALVAFVGGDRSVADKGYLSLNPFKYTQTMLSIVWPLAILLIGGIGLPGGAVYINLGAIRRRGMRSLMSAVGPIATGLCFLFVLLPFVLRRMGRMTGHTELWAGLAFLEFIQLTALFINLLPIPGLDGFGILEPFLPQSWLPVTYTIRRFAFFIIMLLFFYVPLVENIVFAGTAISLSIFGVDPNLFIQGYHLFRFWSGG
jgi:Zn-dependent protease